MALIIRIADSNNMTIISANLRCSDVRSDYVSLTYALTRVFSACCGPRLPKCSLKLLLRRRYSKSSEMRLYYSSETYPFTNLWYYDNSALLSINSVYLERKVLFFSSRPSECIICGTAYCPSCQIFALLLVLLAQVLFRLYKWYRYLASYNHLFRYKLDKTGVAN